MNRAEAAPRIARVGAAFRASPWTAPAPAGGWRDVFALHAGEDADAPPLLGRYEHIDEAIEFTPRFPPAPSLRLRAVFRPLDRAPVTDWFGGVPEPERAPSTRVVSVTPSAGVWPENVLRVYVTFSAPMRLGVAWDHVRMLDAGGRPMGGMLVQIDQELWDPAGRRLTLLFDPGRIKRGLVDHINEGPPLTPGEIYTLEIDGFWRDAKGALLAAPFRKLISVGPPLRGALDTAEWRITTPTAPDAPLTVDFPHPLDAALARRCFSLARGGVSIACAAELAVDETRLWLTPSEPWREGDHHLVADPVLEDIAGNRIGRPFDVDVRDPAQRSEARAARVAFRI